MTSASSGNLFDPPVTKHPGYDLNDPAELFADPGHVDDGTPPTDEHLDPVELRFGIEQGMDFGPELDDEAAAWYLDEVQCRGDIEHLRELVSSAFAQATDEWPQIELARKIVALQKLCE